MKVTVIDRLGPENLIKNFGHPADLEAALTPVFGESLLLIERKSWTRYIKSLELLDLSERALFEKFQALDLCLTRLPENFHADAELSEAQSNIMPITRLVTSQEYKEAKKYHSKEVEDGAPRDEVFESKFGHLLPTVSTFYYIDAYFHNSLRRGLQVGIQNSGAWYMLEALIKAKVSEVRIKTGATFQESDFEGRDKVPDYAATQTQFERIYDKTQIEQKIEILKQAHKSQTAVTIDIFKRRDKRTENDPDLKPLPHDRLGYLKFKSTNTDLPTSALMYFNNGPGVDLFSAERNQLGLAHVNKIEVSEPTYLEQIGSKCILFGSINHLT
jgi:hypothetical protein